MRINKVLVRFYKSFNYDYERKFARSSQPDPWEILDGSWYPYVSLDLEDSITTVVGANESGKSHLLDAIEKLITGQEIARSDFCRYSHFFSVVEGERRHPDFGGQFEVTNPEDVELVDKHFGVDIQIGSKFYLFRPNGGSPIVYVNGNDVPLEVAVSQADLASMLPNVFRLDSNVPLPASIPLHELSSSARRPSGSRRSRWDVFTGVLGRRWNSSEEFTKAMPALYPLVSVDNPETDYSNQQYELGRDLLFRVARIDPTIFKDLSDAIAEEREGYVNAIIQKINSGLATHLNFPRWWAQDREFRLMVSPREFDIVFTIRDKTGTDYSFSERSNGLKYFLSYHVQLLAHRAPISDQQEILLMDEPDAYLSSQGQQDLLRILEEFAIPEGGARRDQVVYVTHSPFLINRNAGDRIRVLDKGVTDEGTRTVKDVSRNHYEPLRSSLGSFVAETSFIGGANLFVEGLADQVLLAGISSHLQALGASKFDTLDLNTMTIVPAGSASSVPYLVYLARGRDVVRPPCVALLDSDEAGNEAVKTLARGGARRKQILPPEFIMQVGSWAGATSLSVEENVTVNELEDLISLPLAAAAARNYAVKVVEAHAETVSRFTEEDVARELREDPGSIFDAVRGAFARHFGEGAHIEKVGFAREVVAALKKSRANGIELTGFHQVEMNFGALLKELARLMRRATSKERERRLNNKLERTIANFVSDYPKPTTRERGRVLIEEIQASVDDSDVGDRIVLATESIRRDFELDNSLTEPISRFDEFLLQVQGLGYAERFAKRDHGAVELESAEVVKEENPLKETEPAGSNSLDQLSHSEAESTQ